MPKVEAKAIVGVGGGDGGEPLAEKAAPLRRASQVSTIIYAIYD